MIGSNGLPTQVTVRTIKDRQGKNVTRSLSVLAAPVELVALDKKSRKPIVFTVTTPATITNRTAAAVSWTSKLSGGGVEVSLSGKLEMDSCKNTRNFR